MTTQLPPHYDDTNTEQGPAYGSSSDISARWHIVNTPSKGVYGGRGISFVSEPLATPNATASSQLMVGLGYDLVFVDTAQLEVYPIPPHKATSKGSSNEPWKTPLVARILLHREQPTQATVAFADDTGSRIAMDARHMDVDPFLSPSNTTDAPQDILMYFMAGKPDQLPFRWFAEANTAYIESSDFKKAQQLGTGSQPVKEERRRSWMSKFKETVGPAPLTGEDLRRQEEKIRRQKQNLHSDFILRDSRGTVYARFSNEFFKDSTTFTKMPTYEKMTSQHKSWGHIDFTSSYFTALRSSYSTFEKWSDNNLELVALLTLTSILEMNIKLNGGTKPGEAFNATGAVFGGGDPRSEGLPAIVGAGLSALSRGGYWLGNMT